MSGDLSKRLPGYKSVLERPVAKPLDRYEPSPSIEVPLGSPLAALMARNVALQYYNPTADARAQASYYQNLDLGEDARSAFEALSDLVCDTHHTLLPYEPRGHNWVHLRPNLRLEPIYGDEPVRADSPLRLGLPVLSNKRLKRSPEAREKALSRLEAEGRQWVAAIGASLDPVSAALRIAELEARRYFNVEHVVAKYWFDSNDIMKGDLHHLFPEVKDRNSFRGNLPLGELDGAGDARDSDHFEPAAGKGAVARATLYFLLRYPRAIGGEGEYTAADIDQLLEWHRADPPDLYEFHRNAEIEKLQGNRNPFIDHPEWADRVDFGLGLARG
ncbi:MAG: endonuclease I family protein [Vulcanimicrobiota bacterium]